MEASWVFKILRQFFASVDKIVYWLLEELISLFDSLASIRLFETPTIESFANRIYFFIAIIMLFKVSFSIIQYIINPDMFSDKERGMGKIVQSILISLVLLVSVRFIFDAAYDLQKRVIDTNIVPRLILGVDTGNGNGVSSEAQKNNKKIIPFKLLSSFITPNDQLSGVDYKAGKYYCGGNEMLIIDDNNKLMIKDEFADCFTEKTSQKTGSYGVHKVSNNLFVPNGQSVVMTPGKNGFGGTLYLAYKDNNYKYLLNDAAEVSVNNDKIFVFDYKFLVSTAAGIFAIIMYINFCFDLGIRAIKFGFLQLIGPIPIISMIDPKSAKNGMMSKWTKQCVSTYIGLFIRILAVNFVVLIIEIITTTRNATIAGNQLINIVIIFAALMFAKEVPKLLSDLTGVDLSGNFKMNPFSRIPGIKQMTKGGKMLTAGAIGLAGSGLGSMGSNIINGVKEGRGFFRTAGSALGGLTSGAARGLRAGLAEKGSNKIFAGIGKGVKGSNDARNLRTRRNLAGDGGYGGAVRRANERLDSLAGISSDISKYDKEIESYNNIQQQAEAILSRGEKEWIKYNNIQFRDSESGQMISSGDFKVQQAKLQALENMDTSHMSKYNLEQHSREIAQLRGTVAMNSKRVAQAYVDMIRGGTLTKWDDEHKQLVRVNDSQVTDMADHLLRDISSSTYSTVHERASEIFGRYGETGQGFDELAKSMDSAAKHVKEGTDYSKAVANKKLDSNNK